MEMLSYFGGDKHEFILAVITLKHVHSCPMNKQSKSSKSIYTNEILS